MKMSEDERQCLSESRGGLLMSFLFLVIARVAIRTKAWFPFGHFLPFVARFGFSYQQKATTSNAMLKWKHPQKTKTSNKKP